TVRARVPVRARGSIRDGRVETTEPRIAEVHRAGVTIIAVGRDTGRAGPRLTRLITVAQGSVRARGPVRDSGVEYTRARIALVDGARIAIVHAESGPGDTHAVAARLHTVADVRVGA